MKTCPHCGGAHAPEVHTDWRAAEREADRLEALEEGRVAGVVGARSALWRAHAWVLRQREVAR